MPTGHAGDVTRRAWSSPAISKLAFVGLLVLGVVLALMFRGGQTIMFVVVALVFAAVVWGDAHRWLNRRR